MNTYLSLVTLLTLVVYLWITGRVGAARVRTGVKAPSTSGNEEFERHYRVQQNTVEQTLIFLPALWLFGTSVDAAIGAGIGMLFVVGRIVYAVTYVNAPAKRTVGFVLGFVANVLLLLGALGSTLMTLLS